MSHKKPITFVVLLASFNGQDWIEEQIKSILYSTTEDIKIYISVDSSIDATEAIVDRLRNSFSNIEILQHGYKFGDAAKNFFRLLRDVNFSDADYICFSDQDDLWSKNKLMRAHEILSSTGADAYSSNVTAIWPDGRKMLIDKAQSQVRWDFLFEAAGPGCTYVIKNPLACAIQNLVRSRWDDVQEIGLHDWLAYAFARANGYKWVIDDVPGMLYRQHERNQIGVNVGWIAFHHRAKKVLSGWGLAQSALIARLVGLNDDPFVLRWADGSRWGLLYLALHAWQCRRRVRDKFIFSLSCLVLSVTRRSGL
jgi:rhamnosyltransferase